MSIERVAVLGGGLMGSGIAEVIAAAGLPVVVREINEDALDAARGRIEASVARMVKRGKLSEDEAGALIDRIEFVTELADIDGVDLVIEAVPEDVELKTQVLAQVAHVVDPDTLIASNTSSIPIAQLASALPAPERVLGLHFFSPVPAMGLVEVVVALDTSEEAVVAGKQFAERIGKTAIETKDRSGFIVNMLLVPYLMAAVRMYEEGFASAEDIDRGMQLGCGHPMGPLALLDFVGLDTTVRIAEIMFDEYREPRYAAPPLLRRMVAAGLHGRKSGGGFYDYSVDPPTPRDLGLT